MNVASFNLSEQVISAFLTKITLGIPEVEGLAREVQLQILRMGLHNNAEAARSVAFRLLEDEEKVELLTRAFVKAQFVEGMKERVGEPEAVALAAVLFDFAYPTPPPEWFIRAHSS